MLAIHVPEPLHERLVFIGHREPASEDIGEAGTGLCAEMLVEVEEEVVEDGKLLVDGGLAVADLLV